MKESLKVLLSSRYVRDLATLMVAYGISINLLEVTWKSKLKAQVFFLSFVFFRLFMSLGVLYSVICNTSLVHLAVSQSK
jgi:ATP/ADP translocase